MSRFLVGIAAAMAVLVLALPSIAKDVYVRGYYRGNGTYVRPHIRSSPDNYLWNNYGPSKTDDQLMNPQARDYDGDGVANYLDLDDDNDGAYDDADDAQFGGGADATRPGGASRPAPVAVARIVVSPGVDFLGGDYAQWRPTSLKACHDYCFGDIQCRGFSYVQSKSWCWLKSALGAPTLATGVVSGSKQ